MKTKLLNLMLVLILLLNPVSILAAEDTQTTNGVGSMSCTVTASIPDPNQYTVTIPKSLEMDTNTNKAEYQVSVTGTLANDYLIAVTPDNKFEMVNEDDKVIATVMQERTKWDNTEVDGTVLATGIVSVEEFTSYGEWSGTLNFTVEILLEPGAYDGFDNKLATWEELEALGFCTQSGNDYVVNNFATYVSNNQSLSSVSKIILDDKVTHLGEDAFNGCDYLKDITLSRNLKEIGTYAFKDCSGLEYIKVDLGNAIYDSRNDCNAIIVTDTNELFFGCKNTVIPNSVESIRNFAFNNCTGLTEITIPDSVGEIGYNTFMGCSNLTKIYYNGNAGDSAGTNWGAPNAQVIRQ